MHRPSCPCVSTRERARRASQGICFFPSLHPFSPPARAVFNILSLIPRGQIRANTSFCRDSGFYSAHSHPTSDRRPAAMATKQKLTFSPWFYRGEPRKSSSLDTMHWRYITQDHPLLVYGASCLGTSSSGPAFHMTRPTSPAWASPTGSSRFGDV